jgi:hypothetical protein
VQSLPFSVDLTKPHFALADYQEEGDELGDQLQIFYHKAITYCIP